MSSTGGSFSRRDMLQVAAGSVVALAARPGIVRAADETRLTVADPGGPYGPAFRKAFYDPFEQATGVKIVNVAHDSTPVAQVKAMVEAKSYLWAQASPHFLCDIKELSGRRAIPERIVEPA